LKRVKVVEKTKLVRANNPDNVVVMFHPHFRKPTHPKLYHKYTFIRFGSWTREYIQTINDEESAEDRWELLLENAPDSVHAALRMENNLYDWLKIVKLDPIFAEQDQDLDQGDGEQADGQNALGNRERHDRVRRSAFGWMAASGMMPRGAIACLGPWDGDKEVAIDRNYDWLHHRNYNYSQDQVEVGPNFLENAINSSQHGHRLGQRLRHVDPNELNVKQRLWFDFVVAGYHMNVEQLVLIFGQAGTGKSHTLSSILSVLPVNTVITCAPTGKAANLIDGATIHSTFKIPVQKKKAAFAMLDKDRLRQLQERFANIRAVFIDESSQLSQEMLAKIDSRCSQATGRKNVLF
jgi:hypothetical protein